MLDERKRMEKDKQELLFAPSMSAESFKERLGEIHYRDVPLIGTLKPKARISSRRCTAFSRCRRASDASRSVT